MATSEFKKSLFRIISDLIKSDKTISTRELDYLQTVIKTHSITDKDITNSSSHTLEEAATYISKQKQNLKDIVQNCMLECALKDGECSREESILISAIELICEGKGKILSRPLNNRPIINSQLLYIDPSRNPKPNELDKRYDELKRITELAGFEIIYMPNIANSFRRKRIDDIKNLLLITNPKLNEACLDIHIKSLLNIDSAYLLNEVLNEKLEMGIKTERPIWLIKLQNSEVNGITYANYLCYDVQVENIRSQLNEFVRRLNQRMNSYSVIVNRRSENCLEFSYEGFYKALLDTIAAEIKSPWEIIVYTRGGIDAIVDKSATGKKFSIAIRRGSEHYPIRINGREAAFYLLILCASASSEQAINFEYERERTRIIQNQYKAAYEIFSNRDSHIPDITMASTFRPIKAKVLKELKNCGIKDSLHLFNPTKKGRNTYYIPMPSENIKIVSSKGEISLKNSEIFKLFECL